MTERPDRILVVTDVNIGDAVLGQTAIKALKRRFPLAKVDYLFAASAGPLVEQNPLIARPFPGFLGSKRPAVADLSIVESLVTREKYGLVLNFCPFLVTGNFSGAACPVVSPTKLVAEILAARNSPTDLAHIGFHLAQHVDDVADMFADDRSHPSNEQDESDYGKTEVFLGNRALAMRDDFLRKTHIRTRSSVVFFNPDASNRSTFIEPQLQRAVLEGLLRSEVVDRVLLGTGFTFTGIENWLCDNVPSVLQRKVVKVPRSLHIDAYAALIDTAAVYLTGDTGPAHVAAARKIHPAKGTTFRNATALVGVFGASDARIYGYDSHMAGYAPTAQDAPARLFEGLCPRKSVTCSLQRLATTCATDRCFHGIDPAKIVASVANYLGTGKLYEHQ